MNFLENHNRERNENLDASLQEVETRVKRAQNTSIPDSTFFQNKLHAQILEKRRSKQASMNPFISFFKNRRPSPKRTFAAVIALLLIVAVTATYLNQSGGSLFVSPVYAQDNFEVTPTIGDAFAVESNTHFIVKSKAAIDTSDLKKSLKLSPDVAYKINKKSDHEFEIIPEKSLQPREVYNLKIDYAYVNEQNVTVERDYSFAFQVKNQLKVITTLPGKNTSQVPLDTGIELTFSSENVSQFESAFSIQPAVQGTFQKHNRTWVFVPSNLTPKQLYTVTLSKNIKVEGANPMTEDYTFQFETASGESTNSYDNSDSWGISDTSSFLEFGSKQTVLVPLWTREGSTSEFSVRAFAFPSDQAFFDMVKQKDTAPSWASYTRQKDTVDISKLQKVAEYSLQPQKFSYNSYLVLPNNMSPGYYVFEVGRDGRTSQVLVIVSNLTSFVEVTDTKTLVWVNNLLTQKPQAGATVQAGTLTASTNQDGVAIFDTDKIFVNTNEQSYNKPEYIQVKSGNESILMRVYSSGGYSYYDYRGSVTDEYWKHIALDRGVYKTTDNVKFWGILKPRTGESSPSEITVALLAPSGWYWYSESEEDNYLLQNLVKVNSGGVFEGEMKLSNLTPGYYTLVFKKGTEVLENRYIEIQSYIKPSYTMSVSAPKNAVYANEAMPFTVKASFFEGTPVSKLGIQYRGTDAGSVATNEQGEVTIPITVPYSACTLENGCGRSYSMSFNASPSRAEDGEITQYSSAQVFYSHVDTRLQIETIGTNLAQVSSTVYLRDISYLNNDSYEDDYLSTKAVASGKKLTGLIKEISYTKEETGEYYDFINKKKVKTYTYNRVEKDHMRFNGITDNIGHYSFDFALDPEKSYIVSMIVEDGLGFQDYAQSYYYTRRGYESGQSSNYTWYSLRLPENRYSFSIGEQVDLQTYKNENKLENPTGPILYYTLKNGLRDFQVTNASVYSFTFADQDVPNVYVGGIYFDGKTYNKISQDGPVSVPFRADDRKLDIDIQMNKAEFKPGEEASVSLSALDKNGKGHLSTVNISIIDEAYFAVGSAGGGNALYNLYSPVNSGEDYSYQTHNYTRLDRFGGAEKGCFLPGTKITMANGTLKNIEDVKVGDEILTFADAFASQMVKAKVEKLQQHTVDQYLVINDHLRVTPEHRILINGQWRTAGTAKVGDILRDAKNQALPITSIQKKYSVVTVYNFTVEKYHTYIADGIWVHNDKGDGAARMDFPDVALYQTVTTDNNGKATLSLKLPDNITSWRITAQAVSNDLYAGDAIKNFNATLPMFVTTNFAKDLLVGDAPLLVVRAFGKGVTTGDKMQGTVRAPFLPQGEAKVSGTVFEPALVNIPQLETGTYTVTTSLQVKQLSDGVVQKVNVVPTRLTRSIAVPVSVQAGVVPGGKIGLTKFVLTDAGRGKYYRDIVTLLCACGDRVDQKIGRVGAIKILEQHFGEKDLVDTLDLKNFQDNQGGIRLLPYADPDQELSAKMAALAPEKFDQERLAQYFYKYLADGKDNNREEVILAVYGLSALREPVLPSVRSLAQIPDLTPKEKLYVGLSFAELGDSESARKIYRDLLNQFGENVNIETLKVKIGDTPDDVIQNTALMSVLGAQVNEQGSDLLYNYANNAKTTDILINIEKLLFLESYVPSLPASSDGEVTVSIGGKTQVVKLQSGWAEEVWAAPQNLASVKFSNVKGPVQIMSVYDVPLTETESKPAKAISIERKYFVDGKEVQLIHEGEVVQVRVYAKITPEALAGDYGIVDVLPAGLRAISNPYRYDTGWKCTTAYPSEVNGQIVKFSLWKGGSYLCGGNYFSYYARVSSFGTFKTDNILIQSQRKPEYLNYSGAGKTLTIQQ